MDTKRILEEPPPSINITLRGLGCLLKACPSVDYLSVAADATVCMYAEIEP